MENLSSYILNRYLDADTNEKTWNDIVNRISKIYPPIKDFIYSKKFIPGGRTIATLGTSKRMIPNCVTIDLEDDLTDIFTTMTRLMELTRRGSGIGMNFGKLRPVGSLCKKFSAKSSGPVGFLYMFSVVMKTIQQQSRHGAFMGILPITHPDIIAFINVKQNLKLINNFNLSVLITADFINRLIFTPNAKVVADYTITHADGTIEKITDINYITYNESFVVQDVSPIEITYKELFDEVIKCAWCTGEPGFLFEDNINENNQLINILGKITTTNPCGEQAMYENECCNLGSINLSEFCDDLQFNPYEVYGYMKVVNSNNTNSNNVVMNIYNNHIHKNELINCVHNAVIYLNNVIDYITIDDDKIATMMKIMRRIGLGIMGLHDMLIKVKLPYDSIEGRKLIEYIMADIQNEAYETSNMLTKNYSSVVDRLKKAKLLPTNIYANNANYIVNNEHANNTGNKIANNNIGNEHANNIGNKIANNKVDDKNINLINKINSVGSMSNILDISNTIGINDRANVSLMTVAPNGSTSMIPNVSSGIEPYFSLGYYRLLDNATSRSKLVVNKQLQNWISKNIEPSKQEYILMKIINEGIEHVDIIPTYIKNVFKTAQDILPSDHVKMQAVVQKYIDNSISKTINLPEEATEQDIFNVVLLAHKLKIKGLTVYRDNCRENVITNSLSIDNCKNGSCDI